MTNEYRAVKSLYDHILPPQPSPISMSPILIESYALAI